MALQKPTSKQDGDCTFSPSRTLWMRKPKPCSEGGADIHVHSALTVPTPYWSDLRTVLGSLLQVHQSCPGPTFRGGKEGPPCSLCIHQQKLGFSVLAEAAQMQRGVEEQQPQAAETEDRRLVLLDTLKNELRLDSHRQQHPGSGLSQRPFRLSLQAWALVQVMTGRRAAAHQLSSSSPSAPGQLQWWAAQPTAFGD